MENKQQDYVLETRDICKTYGALKANDHISIKIKRNSIHAIVGENGAGKSTLMGILTDIVKPDYGDIILNGEKVVFKSPMDAARHGIGMIYQEFMLAPRFTVLQNIIVGFEEKRALSWILRPAGSGWKRSAGTIILTFPWTR